MRAVLASTSACNIKRSIFSIDNSLLTKYKIWIIGIGAGIGVGIGAYYVVFNSLKITYFFRFGEGLKKD